MKIQEKKHEQKSSLGSVLGTAIIVAVSPVILAFNTGLEIPYDALVPFAYLSTMLVLVLGLAARCRVPTKSWVLIACLYGITQGLTLWSAISLYGSYDSLDLFNALGKVIGVWVFAGMGSSLRLTGTEYVRFLRIIIGVTIVAISYNLMINGSSFSSAFNPSASSYSISFSSFFANRNQFGQFLFLSVFAHLLYVGRTRFRFWNFLLFTSQTISLVLTFSRGAIAATAVLVLVFAVAKLQTRPLRLASLALGLVVVSVAFFVQWGDTIVRLLFRPEVGLSGRDVAWDFGVQVWHDSSLLLGSGIFSGLNEAQSRGMMLGEFHSFFIETLVAGGLVELIFVACLVVYSASRLLKSKFGATTKHIYLAGYSGLFVLCAIESISFFTIGFVGTAFSMFFVLLPNTLANGIDDGDEPESALSITDLNSPKSI